MCIAFEGETDFPRYSHGKSMHSLNKELARFLTADNHYNRDDLDDGFDLMNMDNGGSQLPWRMKSVGGHFDHQMANKNEGFPSSMNHLRNSWYKRREEVDDVNKRSGSVFRERSSNDFQGKITVNLLL